MATEKERFEILMEEMRSSFKVVAEGHEILLNKINTVHQELNERIDGLDEKIMWSNNALHEKIDKVEFRLNEKIDKEINEVKKGINKIDIKLTHVIERQDIQEEKLGKVYKKIFAVN